ncbi:MAG: V-type ATP synthase subunit A [Candidatus Aenigmarchaeota archaeon ex4484_52]|nr:MAG: V-type ATP synthase subunit A [Candidatus Aenigmarchaeota archaeon ex4484_52]
MKNIGNIYRISGPVVVAQNLNAKMYDVVLVGNKKLIGEVIQIIGDKTIIQVYEETTGLCPGEPVENTNEPLSVELGPGLLKSIYDGIQRPLQGLEKKSGNFIERGISVNSLERDKKWNFVPALKKGDKIKEGDVLGSVQETPTILHKIIVPKGKSGIIKNIKKGEFTLNDIICELENGEKLTLMQKWPIRSARPSKEKLPPEIPLITGMRILDSLFPLAKGGTAAIPGPFGAGKTVTQQSLAKYSDAEIVVYIGCGERGNEMTEVLVEFPQLEDPKTKTPLMNRTVLIANTSNMPVAAREASVYTGITIAEYFRDMGYDVSLMADSTSRWAESMREISSRLEEMPGEEGYPTYLGSRLAEFYERAGRVKCLNNEVGSISVIGAVSPPGGDFSEPVTQNTLRIVKVFWALDAKLSSRRHYPSINWLQSYSLYKDTLSNWYEKQISSNWTELINKAMKILQEEEKLQEIVQLVGSDALPEKQQITLEIARLLREFFLQQNAFHKTDAYSSLDKTNAILETILWVEKKALETLELGVCAKDIVFSKSKNKIANAKFEENYKQELINAKNEIEKEFEELIRNLV